MNKSSGCILADVGKTRANSKQTTIFNTVCLRIEDVKKIQKQDNCWRVYNVSFKNVLLYGITVVLNQFIKNNETIYTLSVDDETESITGYLKKVKKYFQIPKKNSEFSREVGHLNQRKETGINLRGIFYPSESPEAIEIIQNVSGLQQMIKDNLQHYEHRYQLGMMSERALVHARPFINAEKNCINLSVIDLWLCDEIELRWIRHINKIYPNYFS